MIREKGQIFILSLIALTIVMVYVVVLAASSLTFSQNSKYAVETLQATNLAEAGIDKAVASLNKSGGSYNGEQETALGSGTYEVTVQSKDSSTNIIKATGYMPNKANAVSKKTIQVQISKGIGVAFNYGVQVDEGGLDMKNSATINGSVYTNGNITMSNTTKITGDVYVAGGTQPTANQQNECVDPNCSDFIFGKIINGQLDVAQSFKPSVTAVVNKASLKLKKTGSPPNLTVRIMTDNSGKPSKTMLTSGTLYANQVSNSSYGFIDIAFVSNPTLVEGTSYWIMIDSAADSSNYWSWDLDTLQGYNNGTGRWSPNWNTSTPVWNNTTPQGDFSFKIFMGGVVTSIKATNSPSILGDAHTNTIMGMTIGRDAYYQVESGNTVSGQNCSNNTHCHPGSTDPPPLSMPISQTNIDDWRTQAQNAGNLNAPSCNGNPVWGPGVYNGSLTLDHTCRVVIKSPVLITGNLEMDNDSQLKLDSSAGASSGVVLVSNFIILKNSNKILGSGTQGSYLIAISEFNSRDDPLSRDAITIANSGNQGIVYSNLGSINISNSNTLTEITGWKLKLSNTAVVNYDQGLANAFFTSGPSGSFSVIRGSYQIK